MEWFYDDSKDLTEGLITENDEGNWNQVAQVFPNFREYGHKMAACNVMYEALHKIRAMSDKTIIYDIANTALNKAGGR